MYKIRQATFADMDFIVEMARNEGWDPGIYDAKSFFTADNKGFFIGELNSVPISCISAVKYNDYAFIGFYIVKKEFRGEGYGLKIWQHALNYLGNINIGLDGVVAQIENYKKFGFKLAHSNARYLGNFSSVEIENSCIVDTNFVDFSDLCEYDKLHFATSRTGFLKEWINQKESFSVCYLEDKKIKGFSTLRKTFGGYKIGPLFADNKVIAESILLSLTSKIPDHDFYLDINENFRPTVELVNKYQMQKVFETSRMYTKTQPVAKWDEVFGITSFELG